MKKMLALIMAIGLMLSTSACQSAVRSLGGEMTIDLAPGMKLELITWKNDSLWICTRPMRPDETPEIHSYKEDSSFGVLEGEVTIREHEAAND